jgi:hypothetical protein
MIETITKNVTSKNIITIYQETKNKNYINSNNTLQSNRLNLLLILAINKNNNKHSKININNNDGGIFSEIKTEHCSDCNIQNNLFPLLLPLFETFNHTLFIYQIKKFLH